MKDIIRVGAVSLAAIPGDTEANLEKIKQWVIKAIEEKVELLLFPELSLSGYWTRDELYYEAQKRDGDAIQNLIHFLKDFSASIAISVGLAENYGGCIYNTQITLNKTGILSYYRKTHWPHAEMGTWSCGDRYPIHNFEGINIGTAICYDNNFPEIHRIYGLKGADLILSPYAYGRKFDYNDPDSIKRAISSWKDKEKMFLRAAAAANFLWIVACVGGGHVKDYMAEDGDPRGFESHFPGVILFISPEGKVVLESRDDIIEERLLWYDISRLSNLEQRKGTNNFFKNRRTATYTRLTELP